MKAFKIDSANQTVTEVDVDEKNVLADLYKHVGCEMVEIACRIDDDNEIYVDEEGLLKNGPIIGFSYKGAHQPFAGNGLVLGCNDETGESKATTLKLEDVAKNVTFGRLR